MFALGLGAIVMAATFYCFKFIHEAIKPPKPQDENINKTRYRTHLAAIKSKKKKRKFWGA